MKAYRLVLLILLAAVFMSAGCSKAEAPYQRKPFSEPQVKQFLKEKRIKPILIRTIDEETVVLYETKDTVCSYALSVSSNGEIVTSGSKTPKFFNGKLQPVIISGAATTTPYVVVFINEKALLDRAYKLTVTFSNGQKVTELVNGIKGIIVVDETIKDPGISFDSVIIYDKNENVLFSNS